MKYLYMLFIGLALSLASKAQTNITECEYWFDNSYINKVSFAIPAPQSFHLDTVLSTSALAVGMHTIYIRFKDSNNAWSSVLSSPFYKSPLVISPNLLVSYRYWFDNDTAGIVNLNFPNQSQVQNFVNNIDCNGLSSGLHAIHMQARDKNNLWSSVVTDTFTNMTPVNTNICTVPTILFPRHNSSDIATQAHFQWEPIIGTSISYEIDVRPVGASTATVSQTGISNARFEYSGQLSLATAYEWKVRAFINGHPSEWSGANKFTTRNAAPPTGIWGAPLGHFNNAVIYYNGGADSCNSCANPQDNNPIYCPDPCATQVGAATGLKWQCVEFVNRYYWQVYGLKLYSNGLWGNANSFLNQANTAGMIRFFNNNPEKPKAGDAIVWAGNSFNTAGHVAIVKEVVGNSATVVQQNANTTWIRTINLSNSPFWAFPYSSTVGPCLGWFRSQPNLHSPSQDEEIGDLLHLFNWNTNPNQNNGLHNKYDLDIFEKNENGCYEPYYSKMGITETQFLVPQPLQADNDYAYQVSSITASGKVATERTYFSVSPDAQLTTFLNDDSRSTDSLANRFHIHTYRIANNIEYAVTNARVYTQQRGRWVDLEYSNETGDIFVYNLYPGIHLGDTVLAIANGFAVKFEVITQDNLNRESLNIQLDMTGGTSAIMDPSISPYDGVIALNPNSINQADIDLHITAKNHTYYEIAGFGENDDNPEWEYHYAGDSIVAKTLVPGNNPFTLRYISPFDTVYYFKTINYIPVDSFSNQTYLVSIAANPLNSGSLIYVNGQLVKVLSPFEDSIRVPIGANYFTFILPGYRNFAATTYATDTIEIMWENLTDISDNNDLGIKFDIFPNPARQTVVIYYTMPQTGEASISIFDLTGRLIQRVFSTEGRGMGLHRIDWDVVSLPAGLYVCCLKNGIKEYYRKLIVQK